MKKVKFFMLKSKRFLSLTILFSLIVIVSGIAFAEDHYSPLAILGSTSTEGGEIRWHGGISTYPSWTQDIYQSTMRIWMNGNAPENNLVLNGNGDAILGGTLLSGGIEVKSANSTNQGGNIILHGAGSNPKWRQDIFNDTMRFWLDTNTAGDNFILYSDGSASVKNELTTSRLNLRAMGGSEGGEIILKGAGTNPEWTMDVYDNTLRLRNSTGVGSLTLSTDGSAYLPGTFKAKNYACDSDRRYKKDIVPVSNALQKLSLLNGVYYNWKTTEFKDKGFTDKRDMGFIAQDLEKVFPEVVYTDSKGYKSVAYSKLTAVIVEALKAEHTLTQSNTQATASLKQQVAALQKQNAELKQQVASLQKMNQKVAQLESMMKMFMVGMK